MNNKLWTYCYILFVFELIIAIVETLVFVFQFHIFNADYIIKYGNISLTQMNAIYISNINIYCLLCVTIKLLGLIGIYLRSFRNFLLDSFILSISEFDQRN